MPSAFTASYGLTTLPQVRLMLDAAQLPAAQWAPVMHARMHDSPLQAGDREPLYALTDFMRLGEWLMRTTPVSSRLGLVMGRRTRDTDYGIAGQIARSASTVGEALDSFLHYLPLVMQCHTSEPALHTGAQPRLQMHSLAPYSRYNSFIVDGILAGWFRQLSWLTGRNDAVLAVDIEYENCPHAQELLNFFRVPVNFRQAANQLWLKPGALDWPVVTAQPQLHEQLRALGDELLAQRAQRATQTGRLQQWLAPRLSGQSPTVEQAADAMAMAPWTLRRRLQQEGTSFQDVLDSLRRDTAIRLIQQHQLSFGEIAWLLGFSSPGAFQRAFKRWTQRTPGDYRRHQQVKEADYNSVASSA